MKPRFSLLALSALFLVAALPSKGQDITSGLQAWYKFDYQSADPDVKDYSGNNRHLAPVKFGQQQPFDQNMEWQTAAIRGNQYQAVYFPAGRDGDVILSNATGNLWLGIAGSQARSFCSWVKIDPGADDYAGRVLFAYGDDTQPGGRFEIALKGHSIEFENAENTGANDWKNRSVAILNDTDHPQGEWFHLALVFNGTGNRKTGITLYVNGKVLALNPVNNDADLVINTSLQYAPEIGTYMEKMAISDLRFYDRALTAEDIHVICPDDTPPLDPFSIAYLAELIQTAASNGDAEVVIPPGTYTGTVPGNNFIYLNGANDLKIIADNVTMVCGKKTRAIELANCKNVTIQGLKIDYDPLTFTQGDIVAIGNGYVDVKIHKGYDVKAYSRIDIVDPATRFRKRGSIFVWESTASVIGDSVVRISQPDLPGVASVGDMASLSTGADDGIPHALTISNGRGGIKLLNVELYAAPGFGIFESEGEGGTVLDGCKVVPGPLPPGATQERLLSSSWDAIQHKLTRVGPTVENCEVKDAGDDTWSVTNDGEYQLTMVSGNTINVSINTLNVGDTLRTSLVSDFVVVTSKTGALLTLNKTCPWPLGTRLYSPNRRCENFILRGNNFRSSGRILIKAGNGLIENNMIVDGHSGVTVNTEIAPGATGIGKLIIRNNTIKGTGYFMPAPWSNQAGAISIADGEGSTFSPAGAYNDILIENNVFEDILGVNMVITSAGNVKIKENIFKQTGLAMSNNTGEQYNINQNTVVFLRNLNTVVLDSNEVIGQGLNSLLDTVNISGFTKLRRGIFIRSEDPEPLSVTVTGPSPQARFPVNFNIVLKAVVNGGSEIAKVEFYNGNNKLGESTAEPYSFTWQKVPKGFYRIIAKVITADNTSAFSDEVNISVGPVFGDDEITINPRNLFSPNGDGKNDFWEIEFITQYPELKVSVYNKKGEEVFSSIPFDRWDGMYNGSPAKPGVYFYAVRNNNKVIKTGSITLIR